MILKHFWKIVGLLAIVLIGAAYVYSNQASNEANADIVFTDHVKGNPDATVTLVEYGDFQCPACKQFVPAVQEILAAHGDQIRFEFKHFPLVSIHPNAVIAGRAAEAAGQQGKFFDMHDALYENQEAWSASANPQPLFIQYAEQLGLDTQKFKTHMRASALRDRVMEGYEEARALGLSGTPTFILNGEQLTFNTFEEFTDIVARAVSGDVATTTEDSAVVPTQPEVQFGF